MSNQPKNINKPGSESLTEGISREARRTSARKKILFLSLGVFALLLAPFLVNRVVAVPPTPGSGFGAIQYNQANNRLGFSTSTVIIGTSTLNLPPNPPITSKTSADPQLFVVGQFVANSIVANDVSSTVINGGNFTGKIGAPNVTPGVFNQPDSGNYSFPGYLGIATTTNVSLPQTLSVYGGGYFSGNVGIGVELSDYPLHIISAPLSGQTISLNVDNQNNQYNTSIGIISKAYDNPGSYVDYDFYGQGPETLFSGNVGIGTTVGQSLGSNKLTVSGTAMFGNLLEVKAATTTQIRWRRNTTGTFADLISPVGGGRVGISAKNVAPGSAGGLSFYVSPSTADTLAMTIIDSGNVGINTSNPQYKLEVNGTFSAATTTLRGNLIFPDGSQQTTAPLAGSLGGSTNRVVFWQSTTTLGYDSNFYWDNGNKRLGIGTTAPLRPLDIVGDGSNELVGFAKYDGTRKWNINIKAYASPSDGLNFVETGVSDYRLFLEPGGNVGIGTGNPDSKLGVSGNVTIGSGYSDPSNPRPAPANGLIIEGTVGIGTYSPSSNYKLDVLGDTLVTGSSTVTGVAYFNGDVTLGNAGGDRINFAGSVASNIKFLASDYGTSFSILGSDSTYGVSNGGALTIKAGSAWGGISGSGGSLYLKGGDNWGTTGAAGTVYLQGGTILFQTAPDGSTSYTEKMRITGAGNIGIGTTAPGALLEIATSSASALRLKKTAGVIGSVDLFVVVTTVAQTPAVACTSIVGTAKCLYAAVVGNIIDCASVSANTNMRVLCADIGD